MKQTECSQEFTCNMCDEHKAKYDGKTKLGTWAYMCEHCFKLWGIGLGLGKGQKLVRIK